MSKADGELSKTRAETGESGLEADAAKSLAMLLARAGHEVPPDRWPGMLAAFSQLEAMTKLLRQPRTAACEPANIYSLETITRSA